MCKIVHWRFSCAQSYAVRVNRKTVKAPVDAALQLKIQELIQSRGGGYNEREVADIIENALKLLTDVQDTGDVRVIQTAVRELRYAFRMFEPYADKRKVTIFGSARTKPDRQEYKQAVEFGAKIVKAGFMVITEPGPGIMQAGHEGCRSGEQLRRQYSPAVGTNRQSRHRRERETRHLQIFFYPKIDVHPAV